jgi:hypothetical protein
MQGFSSVTFVLSINQHVWLVKLRIHEISTFYFDYNQLTDELVDLSLTVQLIFHGSQNLISPIWLPVYKQPGNSRNTSKRKPILIEVIRPKEKRTTLFIKKMKVLVIGCWDGFWNLKSLLFTFFYFYCWHRYISFSSSLRFGF